MTKGVHNTHQAEIIVSLPEGGELVLQPGDNRLTVEQYRSLKTVPIIRNYFEHGILRDTGAQEEPAPEVKADPEKPLDKMNKAELRARAAELGLSVADDATNAAIIAAITAATSK